MNTTVAFTKHAFERVNNRITLSETEISDILASDNCAVIGQAKGENVVLVLFWSKPDNQFFVAIKNQAENVVITIHLLAWLRRPVDQDILNRLIRQNAPIANCAEVKTPDGQVKDEPPKVGPSKAEESPTKDEHFPAKAGPPKIAQEKSQNYRFLFFLGCRTGTHVRNRTFKIPIAEYPMYYENPAALEQLPEVALRLATFVSEELKADEYVKYAFVSTGNKGERLLLETYQ